ncbi:hypothetical protein CBR_g45331 [Chara braunii]|uniref:MULE transposase domain-containing protein n=1 Tax=Chara braunii TaxID=69332 RepID=A0A388LYD7_CHABU|nr:hypothetical protein CBR_g45331 [Chara braunii]|eukprot:GBG87271.1 hypothetical protein CBR_g45331 [Chara braunii]
MPIPRTSIDPFLNTGQVFAAESSSCAQLATKRSRTVFEDGGLEHILWNSDEDGASDEDVDYSSGKFDDVEPVAGAPLPWLPDEVGFVRAAQEFANITELRKVVADDAVKKKYEFQIVKSDPTRYTVKCKAEGCGWQLHASAVHSGPTFKIKSMTAHCCGGVSKLFVKDIYRQHGVTIKYRLVSSAKEVAKAKIAGLDDDGFCNLWMYCDEVQNSNPGSRAFVQTEEGCHQFKRMFYALEAGLAGFMHCRPLLGLDGTFLKTRYKGIILCAIGVDAEGHLFPVALAIVPGEDNDNWFWFLHHLNATIQSRATNAEIITFLSDRDNGLIDEVSDVFPSSPHGYCMRHLSENIKKRNKCSECQKLLWAAARANTVAKFDNLIAHMRELLLRKFSAQEYRATYAGLIHPLRPRELWASDKVAGDTDGKDSGEGSGVEGDGPDMVESSVLPPVAQAGRVRRTKGAQACKSGRDAN